MKISSRIRKVLALALVTTLAGSSAVSFATTNKLEVEYQVNDNVVRTINGQLSAKKVNSEADAKAVLKSQANLIGVQDIDAELRFVECTHSEDNDIYVYQQYCNGIAFDNAFVTVVVNNETKLAHYLTSSFVPDSVINTKPDVSENDASLIASKKLGCEPDGTADLTIMQAKDGYKLTWLVSDSTGKAFYIDAQTGDILKECDNLSYVTDASISANSVIPKNYSIILDCVGGSNEYYQWHDQLRKIYLVTNFNSINSTMSNAWGSPIESLHKYSNEDYVRSHPLAFDQSDDGAWVRSNMTYGFSGPKNSSILNYPTQSGVLFRVEQVYDFYNNNFNWRGIDNAGGYIYVDARISNKNSYSVNAFSSKFGNLLGFGTNSNGVSLAMDLDIVAHEYQHSVSDRKLKWGFSGYDGYKGVTLALNEGYADVMAEYADILKDGESSNEWLGGYDALYNSTTQDKTYIKDYKANLPANYDYFRNPSAFDTTIEAHDGALVISHAAYLMHKYGIPDDLAANIWYKSMDYLPQGNDVANFRDARNALSIASDSLINQRYSNARTRNLMKARVLIAFNAVKVVAQNSKKGDASGDGKVTTNDINIINSYARGDSDLTPYALSLCDINYDGVVNTTDSNLVASSLSSGTSLSW